MKNEQNEATILTVLARGYSPVDPGLPPNEPTCLSHVALYFSLFIFIEANKTPASNEHSQSSSLPERGWESLSPACHEDTFTYCNTSDSQDLCCSPSAFVMVSHPKIAQPAHTCGKLSLTMALTRASEEPISLCQVCVRDASQGPLSLPLNLDLHNSL